MSVTIAVISVSAPVPAVVGIVISFGKGFLFALGAGGQRGVEQILTRMRDEIRRDMILLGCKSIKELNKTKIAYR